MIFIDCEFTGFTKPELLSIGLVTLDGQELYLEIAGSSPFTWASTFVLDTVRPQFGLMPRAVNTREQMGEIMGAWLLGLNKSTVDIVYDYHADFDLLEQSLQCAGMWNQLKGMLQPTHVGYMLGHPVVEAAMHKSWLDSFAANGIERHHALADARALKCGYHAMHDT